MTVVASDTTPDFGDVVDLTISGHAETPNAVKVNGVAESLGGPPSSTFAQVTIPPGTDFKADGDHQYTPLGANILVTLQFPTEADDSATIQITPASPYVLRTAASAPYPSGTAFPAGTVAGDKFLFLVTAGTLSSIGTDGVVAATAVPLTLERYWYPADLQMWSAKTTLPYTVVSYPTVARQRPQIVPIGESVITRPTVTGSLRTIDLGASDVFRITLVHPLLEEADTQLLIDFWDTNRGATFQLVLSGKTYACVLDNRPRERPSSNAPKRSDVTSVMTATLVA